MKGSWLVLLALAGCPKAGPATQDAELPETASGIALQAPTQILEGGANDLEPGHRGHALGFLIATSPEPAGGEWGPRALYDPDGWVQRQGVTALVGRLHEPATRVLLLDYVRRASGDPYSRGFAGVRLRNLDGDDARIAREATAAAWRAETQRWRQAPLALAALLLGDDEASGPLTGALARGDLALEPDFLVDVGRSGRPDLLASLQEGADWVEPELELVYAVARLSLGDPSGEQILRKALTSPDIGVQLEALEHLASLRNDEADALLRRASGQGTGLVRQTAQLALAARGQAPSEVIVTAATAPDDEIRASAVRFAGERLAGTAASTALSRRDARALEEVLQAGLRDLDPEVRRAAVRGIAAARLPDRPLLLSGSLTDDALDTRLQAAGALLTLASESAGPSRP